MRVVGHEAWVATASLAGIITRYAKANVEASKKDRGRIRDQVVVEVAGWSRDNARRRLTAAAKRLPGPGRQVAARPRKPRTAKFSYDAVKVLGEGLCRLGRAVREELLATSSASIDRYLAPARAKDQIKGNTTTKPSPLLRNSIKIRKAGDEVKTEPGFLEGNTVAHCGRALKGEFAQTLNLTDVHTRWVFTRSRASARRSRSSAKDLGALAGRHRD